ncbi:hypothetical protein [Motilimonas pumila]|uniref:Uncharacterized protein n=1 Tax=Motilimonas pumila TaxID=2303987 RepID=A0A418YFR8_9GAMM|nr:hypothetical protein [Motilimonas pumila]RJG48385.1 hypothetical protein D1Z90_07785 [Motilimonas pumila]
MLVPSTYERIADYPDLIVLLEWPFYFEICKPYLLSKEWPISISKELIDLVEDGSGGAYTSHLNGKLTVGRRFTILVNH